MRMLVLAEFPSRRSLDEACSTLRRIGFEDLDSHSPYPLHGSSEALGLPPSPMPALAAVGGFGGAAAGYLMQWACNAWDFPIIVGDRPAHAPLAFLPIAFECGILGASLFVFFGLLARWRFPQPWHPAFESEAFASASDDGYWVSLTTDTPDRDLPVLRARLAELGATRTETVEVPA